jgi:hypothetical protein
VDDHLTVERQRHLAGGEQAVVHIAAGAREEGVDRAAIQGRHGAQR